MESQYNDETGDELNTWMLFIDVSYDENKA